MSVAIGKLLSPQWKSITPVCNGFVELNAKRGKGKEARKQPKTKINPSLSKTPHLGSNPTSSDTLPPAWQVQIVDMDGPWGWRGVTQTDLIQEILPKLMEFETMTWVKLGENGSHPIPKDQIISAAQQRLVEINQDDIDAIYSLRLTGQRRIWGIRVRNILKILWWDPNHEVKPSRQRHT